MQVSEGRTLTVLNRGGIVFTCILCICKLFLALIDFKQGGTADNNDDGTWGIYIAHKHAFISIYDKEEDRKALGIISGGATIDSGSSEYITAQEKKIPFDLIMKSLSIKVEDAKA